MVELLSSTRENSLQTSCVRMYRKPVKQYLVLVLYLLGTSLMKALCLETQTRIENDNILCQNLPVEKRNIKTSKHTMH